MPIPKVRPEEDWYLRAPQLTDYAKAGLEHARADLRAFERWVADAILEIRYVAARLHSMGSHPNLEGLVESYGDACRQQYESVATLARTVESLRSTANDLRRHAESIISEHPRSAEQLLQQALEVDEMVALYDERVSGHQRLLQAYSDALKTLADVTPEAPEVTRLAPLVGPVVGTAFGALAFTPSSLGLFLGLAAGAFVAYLSWRASSRPQEHA